LLVALEELADEPALRRELGRAARARSAMWDLDTTTWEYERLYARILAGATP
jgi:hypothetical protein